MKRIAAPTSDPAAADTSVSQSSKLIEKNRTEKLKLGIGEIFKQLKALAVL